MARGRDDRLATGVDAVPDLYDSGYLRRVIPMLGRMLLGDPGNYRMLGVYTDRFGDAAGMIEDLRAAGLETRPVTEFFGCATGAVGRRPA